MTSSRGCHQLGCANTSGNSKIQKEDHQAQNPDTPMTPDAVCLNVAQQIRQDQADLAPMPSSCGSRARARSSVRAFCATGRA
jgi:hypothetical protein